MIAFITTLSNKERIYEEMRKQRDRIKHLSQESRRILSNSRERSKERLRIHDLSGTDSKNMSMSLKSLQNDKSLKSVHDRLHKESKVLDHNKTMLQFRENMKIKKLIKYGSKSRSTSRTRKKTLTSIQKSQSSSNLGRAIQNMKNKINLSSRNLNSAEKLKSNGSKERVDFEAQLISAKLYGDAVKRNENFKRQEKKLDQHKNKNKPLLTTSLKYLIKRFIFEYECALRKKKIKNKISYIKAEEILRDLGFITKPPIDQENEENVLFVDLWGCLQGDLKGGINKTNLKIFLGAIQGYDYEDIVNIENQKKNDTNDHTPPPNVKKTEEVRCYDSSDSSQLHTNRPDNNSKHNVSDSRDTTKFVCFEVGYYDAEGVLKLTSKEIKR